MIAVADWMRTVASASGPDNYTVRLLLLTMGAHMDARGRAEISMNRLAEATGLSKSWLYPTVRRAMAQGWIRRQKARTYSKAHNLYAYEPAFPVDRFGLAMFHAKHDRTDHGVAA